MSKIGTLILAGCAEDNAGGSEGEKSAVFDNATLAGIEFDIVDEGACVAVVAGCSEGRLVCRG